MKLLDPSRTGVLNRRIEEDNLVLYPDLMYDGFEDHVVFKELYQNIHQ